MFMLYVFALIQVGQIQTNTPRFLRHADVPWVQRHPGNPHLNRWAAKSEAIRYVRTVSIQGQTLASNSKASKRWKGMAYTISCFL